MTGVGLDANNNLPTGTRLMQNYPNPFNPSTTISFILSKPGEVSLSIYNNLGELIKKLVHQNLLSGQHEYLWDGRDENGNSVASGIYIYKLVNEDVVEPKKMIFLR